MENSNRVPDRQFVLEWLPSLPLIQKHKAPAIAGVAAFYSERLEMLLYVQETDNLIQLLNTSGRQQARALNLDADCRVFWLEIPPGNKRYKVAQHLKLQLQTALIAA